MIYLKKIQYFLLLNYFHYLINYQGYYYIIMNFVNFILFILNYYFFINYFINLIHIIIIQSILTFMRLIVLLNLLLFFNIY